MNASGISIADSLREAWATIAPNVRFIVLAIRDESIVLDTTADVEHDLAADLDMLQGMLQDDVPAYVLARLDDPPTHFLAITYVPDTASVRAKMLYASTRTALTKSLGAASFPDAIFATSKADLTPAAYAAHLRHIAAPQPLSAAERERAAARAAERAAGDATPRQSPLVNAHVQLRWNGHAEHAVAALAHAESGTLVVLSIDPASESIVLVSDAVCAPNDISTALPHDKPSYAFFTWPQADRRDTVFVYSCPNASPVKQRMLFSSTVAFLLLGATSILGAPISKRLETSDPQEIDEAFLRDALGIANNNTDAGHSFAKPRGPARKQR